MNVRRRFTVGVAILAAAGVALTGCKSSGSASATTKPAAATTASSDAAAKAALLKSLSTLTTTGYNLTVTAGNGALTGTGSVDPTTKSANIQVKGTIANTAMTLQLTTINPDVWVQADLGSFNDKIGLDPTKWMKIDPTQLKGGSLPFGMGSGDTNPMEFAAMLDKASTVKQTDATHFTGTVDTADLTSMVPGSSASAAPNAPKTVPFTVTTDAQGRPSEIDIDASQGSQAGNLKVTFADFGAPTAITAPPAADVVPAPQALYSLFGHR